MQDAALFLNLETMKRKGHETIQIVNMQTLMDKSCLPLKLSLFFHKEGNNDCLSFGPCPDKFSQKNSAYQCLVMSCLFVSVNSHSFLFLFSKCVQQMTNDGMINTSYWVLTVQYYTSHKFMHSDLLTIL